MQSTIRLIGSLVLLSSALATYHSSAKLRRDGVLNLYPFPRVGRASQHTWQVPANDYFLEYEPIEKRQLYAFPRVGRAMAPREHFAHDYQAVVRRGEHTGMWFGPRLGRSYKSEDDDTMQNGSTDRSDPEQIETTQEDREKRQIKLL